EALKMGYNFFEEILQSFDNRRNLVYSRLNEIGFDLIKPQGAFYVMPSIKNFNLTGKEFSQKLMKEQAVAVVPGGIFGSFSDHMIRISYATEIEKIKEAMNRIEKFTNKL
ncbi:MAG: aminotransferase class I/II-fold pyridoxal phosphate-dependent enzyme, partial [Candidatus Lokiarchaeota archaeon]|nr:aminotransferase class I/II-fold pyridoxal phosphate-dependent enzyme [Candidatus Lokiarchaeota archaeon]